MSEDKFEKKYHFWRLSWVFQIFFALFLVLFAWRTYIYSVTFFRVEEPLVPGHYSSYQIPDSEVIRMAYTFLGLMEIYTFANAETNFERARKDVNAKYLDEFDSHYMKKEMQAITFNKRSQNLYLDLYGTDILRQDENNIIIGIYGEGDKIANNLRFDVQYYFTLHLTINPDPKGLNDYGLEVVKFDEESLI